MRSSLYSLTGFKLAFAFAQIAPRSVAQWLGGAIALGAYARRPAVRAALEANLRLATGQTASGVRPLARENVRNFGHMLADYFLCAGAKAPQRANELLEDWRGFEHLEAARAGGRGVIVVTGHVGHWELGGVTLARHGWPLTIVTLEEPSTELTRWRDVARAQLGIRTIPVGPGHGFAFVEMIQALRRNELLAMLVDRPYAGTGAPVQFLGRATEFSTAPALLAHHTGAAVLPAFVLQKPSGRYVSFAESIIPMTVSADPRGALAENTQRIATIFEAIVRKHPEQWFNYAPIVTPADG